MCIEVITLWYKQAGRILTKYNEAWVWAALGVVTHFFSSFVDNSYWGLAWSLYYLSGYDATAWFEYGILSNIPFRQLGTSFAAFCYLKAGSIITNKSLSPVIERSLVALLMGSIYVSMLLWIDQK